VNRMITIATGLLAALSISFSGCGGPSYPPDVAAALKAAGDNRGELEKVLGHYAAQDDTLKLRAAYFLIGNMEGHGYVTYDMVDTSGNKLEFNVLDYSDFDALQAAADSLEDEYGELDFEKNELTYDLNVIKAAFLIKQIDQAFAAWRQKPWARYLTFNQFCNYVLPYRGSNEPLENWREMFLEKYEDLDKRMADPSDPMEAASLINDDVKSWFGFDPRFYYHPTDQGLSEMMTNKLGRCEDMTNLAIYALRANGLAITSDYTPYWANSGNNHAWNAILVPDGRVVPFMGAEANPGKYSLSNKVAKVYRKMYAKQLDNLAFQDHKQEKVPRWLAGKSYLDVTADYTDVSDVTVELEREIPDSIDVAYLCVFNSGEWQPIHWGWIENGKALFTDMGRDVAYLPILYINEEIEPAGAPFILDSEGLSEKLKPEDDNTIPVQLTSTTRRKQEISTDGILKTYLTDGQEYELFYWKDGWQSLGKATAGDEPLVIEDVPAGSLYWLVATDSNKEERIFTIEDGRQVWW
jgi:hypothetical protein